VDGTGCGLCSVADFVISDVETSVSATRYLVSVRLCVISLFISITISCLSGLILLFPLAF
jgi:hypothetical protein